ncbi:hypothetical protein DYB35_007610 [Aphanomyces astaci]|uniref:EXPERA domain-containing protein n=1 Tax=Aphanomyces astaci TaxID=112090 RepID=A0A3R7AC19_APHAT|nr:hypothetical protein DYB35_007610 [Aphanomyces astaci]
MPSVVPPDQTLAEAFNKVSGTEFAYMLVPVVALTSAFLLFLVGLNPKRAVCWTPFWLVLSGVIHSFLELSFTFFRDNQYFGNTMDLYSAADYRYGFPMEEGTAAMETITCVHRKPFPAAHIMYLTERVLRALLDGPMCLLAAYAFVTQKPYYHPLVMSVRDVSIMQLYGLTWFCLHPLFSDASHMSSDPGLFWIICVGCNAPWAIFPSVLVHKSFTAIVERFTEAPKAKCA